jgi:hypothetical protein
MTFLHSDSSEWKECPDRLLFLRGIVVSLFSVPNGGMFEVRTEGMLVARRNFILAVDIEIISTFLPFSNRLTERTIRIIYYFYAKILKSPILSDGRCTISW